MTARRVAAWLWVAGILATGCVLNASGKNKCSTSNDCNSGYTCMAGQCVPGACSPTRVCPAGYICTMMGQCLLSTGLGGDAGDSGPGATCDPSMPFAAPILVYGLNRNPGTEQRINLSPDELTAYIAAGTAEGQTRLFVAYRASTADPFGPPMALTQLNRSGGWEISVSATGDGLRLFFDDNSTGVGRIVATTRLAIGEAFGAGSFVPIQEGQQQYDPYVLPDGSALYFTSNATGADLFYRAALDGTTAETPTLAWDQEARLPVVSADELTLYFAGGGAPGEAWGDIWVTTRLLLNESFPKAKPVVELNTPEQDIPQWISPDGCRLYLARSTAGAASYASYLFVAERVRN